MIRIFASFIFIVFSLNGCLSKEEKEIIKENRLELGNIKINYYSNKSVTSLEVPPDLTSPRYENSFRISEYASNIDSNTINLTNKEIEQENKEVILERNDDIKVMKHGDIRWLVIENEADLVWELSKQFLKEKGFSIKKSDKKIGILETDYLEKKPDIPSKSLGLIRSFFSSSIEGVSYTLPSVDSFKIRIEPLDSKRVELYLSSNSMEEVVQGESTIWQSKARDVSLEAEMLYSLMQFLGSDSAVAREKIINAKEEKKVTVNLGKALNQNTKLIFNTNLIETWDNMNWALGYLDIAIEDRDIKEKAFYIKAIKKSEIGVMSRIFGSEAIAASFQIQLKQIDSNTTEVYLNDLSEINDEKTRVFSLEFFEDIKKLF